MAKKSAGILVYRSGKGETEVMLVHPGGPYWAHKDQGVWSIPKGEYTDEEPLVAALREFREEIGSDIDGEFIALTPITQRDGKVVRAWAVEGDIEVANVVCNTFEMEWPPRSGRRQSFPEIDRAEWLGVEQAKLKIIPSQAALIDELIKLVGA